MIVDRQVPLGTSIRASWQFSLDQIQQNTAHFKLGDREALVGLFRWCIDPTHPMPKAEAARRVGVSDNMLYKLFTGKYTHPETKELLPFPDGLADKIREFLKLESQRYEAGENQFVLTPTAKKIVLACELARESQSPVIMWGPSHIGKTWALRYAQQTNNHGRTFLAEFGAASGLGGMVRCLAEACGISDRSNTAYLVERIGNALTPNTLFILDEVHLLKHTYRLNSFFACIEVIRRIYDKARCGFVLSWTNIDNLKHASQGELIQLWRRGVHKIALPVMPTKADLAAILKHNGLEFPARDLRITVAHITESPYEILRQLSKHQGLKAITERIRYARKLANKSQGRISWEKFVEAHLTIESQSTPEPEWS